MAGACFVTRSAAGRPGRAFTLVEMIVSIAIVSVLASVAVVSLRPGMAMRTWAGAQRVQMDIALAQHLAITSGRWVWVDFDVAASSYAITWETSPGTGRGSRTPVVRADTRQPVQTSLDSTDYGWTRLTTVSFNGSNVLGFDPRGVPYDGKGQRLKSAGQVTSDHDWSIGVEPVSGRVSQR